MNAFGVYGCSVITALTAQNTLGVQSAEPVSPEMVRGQLDVLSTDLPPAAIKTGMLGSAETCMILADFLSTLPTPCPPLICDPVLKSTSGANLLDPAALDFLIRGLFPHVAVLTPNLPETQQIIGESGIGTEDAAERILAMGVRSVLIKGGHTEGNECRDYWTDGTQTLWLSSPRIETRATHGTGCILSAAIASAIALDQSIPDAVVSAKTFLNQCLKRPANVGAGYGPVRIEPFRNDEADRPSIVVDGGGDSAPRKAVGGGGDPAPQNPASPPPATTKHAHLRRLSRVFADDPIYFITTNTKERRHILNNPTAHRILREELESAMERHGWAIGFYVVMPDHIHFFCKPTHESKNLSEFMMNWKQWTSKRIKDELKLDGYVWQEEFFDHLLRSHESYSEKWNYVEQNPVRAGLVKDAANWPYKGYIQYSEC